MSFSVDLTELTRLATELGDTTQVEHGMSEGIDRVADGVANDARSNANSYGGTGELGGAVFVRKSGNKMIREREIGADVRQAFFLEVGSPKTGAPRPWLTAPAAKGHHLLAEMLGKMADPL